MQASRPGFPALADVAGRTAAGAITVHNGGKSAGVYMIHAGYPPTGSKKLDPSRCRRKPANSTPVGIELKMKPIDRKVRQIIDRTANIVAIEVPKRMPR